MALISFEVKCNYLEKTRSGIRLFAKDWNAMGMVWKMKPV